VTNRLGRQLRQRSYTVSQVADLEKKGFGHLSILLNKDKERAFLKSISEKSILIRDKTNKFCVNLNQGKVEVTIIPPQQIIGICSENKGQPILTNTGKIIKSIYRRFQQLEVGISFFLTSGSVDEISGEKPSHKRNLNSSFIDNDVVAVVHNPKVSEELIESLIRLDLPEGKDLKSEVKQSCWRNFKIVEIRDNGYSKAQISFPERDGQYLPNLTFLEFALSRRDCPHILLIPMNNVDNFIGALIDLFPERKKYNHFAYSLEGHSSKTKRKNLKPIVYHWPALAFPTSSIAESFYHFLHEFRTWTWQDQLPLADFGKKENFQWRQLLCRLNNRKKEEIMNIAKQLSEWFATEIVYPIAKTPKLVIKNKESLEIVSNRLLTALKKGINGDPSLGLIRMLSRGENPTSLPAFGTGFIDPQGFFPELYEFLHDEDRLDRLIGLMAETQQGPAMKGWPAFLNFIYQETGFDLKKTARLLNPNFCSMEVYPSLVEDFIIPDLELSSA